MLVFLLRRVLQSGVVLLAMSLLVFVGVFAIGNPVDILLSPEADQVEMARTVAAFGLDKPLWTQYLIFLQQAVQGNFGNSFVHGSPALQLILQRMPATLELAIVALLLAVALGIPLGLWAGLRPSSRSGRAIMGLSILGFSLPTFWVGLMLIMLFSIELGWLPSNGRGIPTEFMGLSASFFNWDGFKHILMPAFNLALFKISLVIRLTRAGTEEALLQDYVRYARAKGLRSSRIVGAHVLKNILIPIVTVVGLEFGSLIAFAVVTESIFAWPGMGKLLIESINLLDRPVVVAYLLTVVGLFVLINLLVDILYSLLDPRIRLPGQAE